MGTVVFDISMSLDGYITAAGQTPDEPLGPGGERLHDWLKDTAYLERNVAELGAVITGRRNYDDSLPWWGSNGPTGPERVPVFVVTHRKQPGPPADGVYTFVTDGVEEALRLAQERAGDRVVTVMGGAEIGRQYLAAGLVDEISVHVAATLFGAGTPMFTGLDIGHRALRLTDCLSSPEAVHLRYRLER